MATLTLSAWDRYEFATEASVLSSKSQVYALQVYKRAPEKPPIMRDTPRRCRKDQAVGISCFINEVWQGGVFFSLAQTAVWLAKLGLELGDLENFFQAAVDMGWEDDLILEARRAANQFITAPESSAYLVVKMEGGMVVGYEYLPLTEAQLAVASHCDVETTDLQYSAGVPWGAVFSASDEMGEDDAWAFPVADSGENIADLSARVEIISQHRWQLWEAFHTAAARLRIHGLEVPNVEPSSDTEDEPVADNSVLRRLAVQIPEEMQPAFLATTFDLAVLRAALAIAEQNKEEEEEEES